VTTAYIDPNLWRQQCAAADSAHALMDLADALQAYCDHIYRLPPGDAAGAFRFWIVPGHCFNRGPVAGERIGASRRW
jgi:hypothetical protein